jgi:hypothetical protein
MIMPRKRKDLDAVATARRDKNVDRWLHDHIRQGLREANARQFTSDAEVKLVLGQIRRK